ncbi:MAG: 2OG-Fe(II) oxygenase [Alphaproteobacteria bacterium]|nr:2OG-Fe(II) oxygenase [Alphaproteobacteria bacterium]
MTYPPVPPVDQIAKHFIASVKSSKRLEEPFRRWAIRDVLPVEVCTALLIMPIVPPMLGRTDGTRNTYNERRTFITPKMRAEYPVCQALSEALHRADVAKVMADTCAIDVEGGYLRMEYMQDTEGAWLEPHRDIPEKLFSMVIYLFTGPDTKDWGTDIYDADRRWAGRSGAEFNTGVIFVPGPATWHGYDPRPIIGIRRLMEINYARRDWRDKNQLAFPDRPITLK